MRKLFATYLLLVASPAHASAEAIWFIGGALVGNWLTPRQTDVIVIPQPQVVYHEERTLIATTPNRYNTPYSRNGYGFPPNYYPPRPIYHCNLYRQCQMIGWG